MVADAVDPVSNLEGGEENWGRPPNGGFVDLSPEPIVVTLENPSAEHPMLVIATAVVPNLLLTSMDEFDNPTDQDIAAHRMTRLRHVAGGGEGANHDQVGEYSATFSGGKGVPFAVPTMTLMLKSEVEAGGSGTFRVYDQLYSVTFDPALSDHVNVRMKEQIYQTRVHLAVQGYVLTP